MAIHFNLILNVDAGEKTYKIVIQISVLSWLQNFIMILYSDQINIYY
jgi:L-asparagine transporter-like permease